jgi:single-stranded DNA-binding protein
MLKYSRQKPNLSAEFQVSKDATLRSVPTSLDLKGISFSAYQTYSFKKADGTWDKIFENYTITAYEPSSVAYIQQHFSPSSSFYIEGDVSAKRTTNPSTNQQTVYKTIIVKRIIKLENSFSNTQNQVETTPEVTVESIHDDIPF